MRIIRHPVMGWFVIILLATIVTVPPVFFLISHIAAQLVAITGVTVALIWLLTNVVSHRFHRVG